MGSTPTRDWREIYDGCRTNRLWFKRVLIIYDILCFWFMVASVRHGTPWLTAFGVFLASQLPQLFVGWLWERNNRREGKPSNPFRILNPKTQSWAFLGDYAGLAPMAAVVTLAFPTLPENRWFNGGYWWAWAAVSLMIGTALSASFRKGEGDAYDVLRYFSYTKLLHNGVAFTVLSAFIVFTMIPVLFAGTWSGRGYYPELALGFLLVWLAGAIADGFRAGLPEGHPWRLTGSNLHPQGDETGRRIVPEIPDVPTWSEFKRESPSAAIGWKDLLHTRRLLSPLTWRRFGLRRK